MEFYTEIKGGLGVFTDKALVRDIVQERFGNNTGNATALTTIVSVNPLDETEYEVM